MVAEADRVRAALEAETGAVPEAGALEQALAGDAAYSELSRQLGLIAAIDARTKQGTLGTIAVLPLIMLLSYIALILYFRSRGGYRPRAITDDGAVAAGRVPA